MSKKPKDIIYEAEMYDEGGNENLSDALKIYKKIGICSSAELRNMQLGSTNAPVKIAIKRAHKIVYPLSFILEQTVLDWKGRVGTNEFVNDPYDDDDKRSVSALYDRLIKRLQRHMTLMIETMKHMDPEYEIKEIFLKNTGDEKPDKVIKTARVQGRNREMMDWALEKGWIAGETFKCTRQSLKDILGDGASLSVEVCSPSKVNEGKIAFCNETQQYYESMHQAFTKPLESALITAGIAEGEVRAKITICVYDSVKNANGKTLGELLKEKAKEHKWVSEKEHNKEQILKAV